VRQGTENREQRTGNREQRTENREQGTGNREQGTGNREQGTFKVKGKARPKRGGPFVFDPRWKPFFIVGR
jgi:hypothetical protein